MKLAAAAVLLTCFSAVACAAQAPTVSALFPVGGRAGSSMDVEIRGSALAGARTILVEGTGVHATLEPSSGAADQTNRAIWQQRCKLCHELRSPANRSLSPEQWATTVRRMVEQHQAPISPDEERRITEYLVSMARAGKLMAHFIIAPDALPGVRQIRVLTAAGISAEAPFDVGDLPEVTAVPGALASAQRVTLPCVVNGALAERGERDFFRFAADAGKRYIFNLKGFRYNVQSQMFFNPDLLLHTAGGARVAENHGFFELDPVIDWVCPEAGDYVLEVRDLLGNGNPASVYRLTMGEPGYGRVLYPPAAPAGRSARVSVLEQGGADPRTFDLIAPVRAGLHEVDTPWGSRPFVSTGCPVALSTDAPSVHMLPFAFAGTLTAKVADFYLSGAGRWRLETYCSRLGCTGEARTKIEDESGRVLAQRTGDGSLEIVLQSRRTYRLEVDQEPQAPDPPAVRSAFVVVASQDGPTVSLALRPGALSLALGMSTVALVELLERRGPQAPIDVTVSGLPDGVEAAPLTLLPGESEGWLVLRATGAARPGAYPVLVKASAGGVGALCSPQEEYRLNGEQRFHDEREAVLGLCPAPPFTLSLASVRPLHLEPQAMTPVQVLVRRSAGCRDSFVARVDGLPRGWTAYAESVSGDASAVTLQIRPNGDDQKPFLSGKLGPAHAVVELEDGGLVYVAGTLEIVPPSASTSR